MKIIITCTTILLSFFIQTSYAKVNLDTANITVSGLSSGGFMANQFHLAHAEIVNGAAIIAAGPYNCAQGSLQTAFAQCISKGLETYPKAILNPYSSLNSHAGLIADKSDVENDRVWLLHGSLDTRIAKEVSEGLAKQYSLLVKPENYIYENNKAFSHVFPTDDFGGKCEQSESPFIANCNYDAAGKLLTHIYGKLEPRVSEEDSLKLGQLLKIEQSELTNLRSTSLHEFGYLYVPNACANDAQCKLHISFHGCNQAIGDVEDTYAKHTGLNRWAATNNIVILYPQIEGSTIMPMNPQSCWDWWGYTDENYPNRKGKQISAIREMVNNLPTFVSTLQN